MSSIFIHIQFTKDQNLLYHYNGMEQQETLKNYFDIAFDDIKRKEGFDSVFIVKGNVEQIVDFDDEWKVKYCDRV